MTPPAHPRSRGENLLLRLRGWRSRGSSPLTRGKLIPVDLGDVPEGLIPAHAGKTWNLWLAVSHMAAHPRSRGENRHYGDEQVRSAGSSPLTQGKRTERTERFSRSGLIPAHAGKTDEGCDCEADCRAHPRSRGENEQASALYNMGSGSSPLTRGKQTQISLQVFTGRLIPAHAGKTPKMAAYIAPSTAHPRSRGENGGALADRG